MMDNWPVCTELSEDAWHTSTWFPQMIVNKKLRKMIKDGKPLPSADTMQMVLDEMVQMVKDNNGIHYQSPLNFEPALKKLENSDAKLEDS